MSSPELVAPARLEELLTGAFPETHAEARLQGLARELRTASVAAPWSLRERIGALSTTPNARVRLPRRRLVAALAAGILVLAAGGFAAFRFTTDSGTESENLSLVPRHTERSEPSALGDNLQRMGAGGSEANGSSPPLLVPNIGSPALGARAQNIDMWLDLRVKDADAVSSTSQDAVRITRELGGVVTSSTVDTRGAQGRAQLTLRIPVGRVQDAVFRLTQLGTVTAQKVNTEDLQSPLDILGHRIEHLRSGIRIELARIASGTLEPAEELQARVHLEHLRRNLREAKDRRAAILRQTAMADLTLRLATPTPGAVDKNESGVSGAANKAADFLRGAGAVAVFLALVLSPLILLVVLAWLALRVRNRRVEARLLDDPRPGASTPPT
jgi:Domain of unknown function (DUF4349)